MTTIDDFVLVACPRCQTGIMMEYDRGTSPTRDDPGVPGSWFITNDQQCPHLEDLTDVEWDAMQVEAERSCMDDSRY